MTTNPESRENSFSRSRSSSVSSIDRDTKEAVTTLQFGEFYGRKSDSVAPPSLWVGTSLGVVVVIPMSIPTEQEDRLEEPVSIGPNGECPPDQDRCEKMTVLMIMSLVCPLVFRMYQYMSEYFGKTLKMNTDDSLTLEVFELHTVDFIYKNVKLKNKDYKYSVMTS